MPSLKTDPMPHQPVQVCPDWTVQGTKEKLEERIGNGFTIKGPGLYLTDTDTVLVQLNEETRDNFKAWSISHKGDNQLDQHYVVYVYNTKIENTIWGEINLVRTREDKRS
jgi:hypothetical protein